MKIYYRYKGTKADDIRDIVYNNKLEIDFEYIMEEYLPFQAFITGRTFFKDVFIEPSIKFDPFKLVSYQSFDGEFFSESVKEYLDEHKFDRSKKTAAAVSGGVDSSTVALEIKPDLIYSGFYSAEDYYDETPFSREVAEVLGIKQHTYELDEIDFLSHMEENIEIICTPIAGMGSTMEFAVLRKVLNDVPDIEQVLFGNGGDEIFVGYFFNHYIKEFYENGNDVPDYMPNFAPSKLAITKKVIDFMTVASLNRGDLSVLYSPFVISEFIPMIDKIDTIVDKMLFVNINVTLPTLLHLNNQMCKAVGVSGFNPISNKKLIRASKYINTPMSDIPKQKLREARSDLPVMIKDNMLKRGFPIPYNTWENLSMVMRNAYHSFFKRKEMSLDKLPYPGINRYTWGIFQAELCLRRFG